MFSIAIHVNTGREVYRILVRERGAEGMGGGHSNRSCTCTRDRGQNFGQVAKVENLSSQRVKAKFSWSKSVQRSTSGGCGLISFEVGQGSRPTLRCGQEVKA